MNEATNNYTVYKHTTPSGKVYVGITLQAVEKRWGKGHNYKKNSHFYSAIQKYGWDNISHEIIAEHLTKEEACALEVKLIAEYDSTNRERGYNNSRGGESNTVGATFNRGIKRSEETRKKLSEAMRRVYANDAGNMICNRTRKKVLCKEEGIVYKSLGEAARAHDAAVSTISCICHGRRPPLHGCYSFVFV